MHRTLAWHCFVPAFVFVSSAKLCQAAAAPSEVEHGLLQGYGITLGAINGLNLISSILQAVPNLQIQVVTLITWMIARFFMYSR